MSNSDRNSKNPPPDDFSMTTPGIRIPKDRYSAPKEEASDDWAKTNYNLSMKPPSSSPQSPPADDWGKTAANIDIPRNNDRAPRQPDDFDKTFIPGQPAKDDNWNQTQANINIPRDNTPRASYGNERQPEYGATSPYFQLPESERAKYQNLPPAAPETENKKPKKIGGVPIWAWASAGIFAVFLFAAIVLIAAKYMFSTTGGFELTVKDAPAGSEIFVDGQRWNLSSADGSYKLPGLKADEQKIIEIRKAGYKCEPEKITGESGATKQISARCAPIQIAPPVDDCQNVKKGDFAKASKCANDALDRLKDPVSVDDLLKAMNLYIINFPSGKFDIVKPEDKAFLQKAAGYIQKLPPNVVIEVGGHTDNVGSKPSNQILSENRAKSVKSALVALGVKDSILQMKGYGDAKPKSSNDTDDGKFQNRRIEYSALSK